MNIIGIFSPPRSGSSWLGQLYNSNPKTMYKFQPNFSYSFPFTMSPESNRREIELFFDRLIVTDDPFVNGRITISSKQGLTFSKKELTTLVFKETHSINIIENLLLKSDVKVVGLLRSPYATINSWLKTPKEFSPNWDIREEWRSGKKKNNESELNYFGYDKWKEVANIFLSLNEKENRFKLVKYEDLLTDTLNTVKDLFDFSNLPLTDQTIEFIDESKSAQNEDPYSVYKSKFDDNEWKDQLPPYIIEDITKDIMNTRLKFYLP